MQFKTVSKYRQTQIIQTPFSYTLRTLVPFGVVHIWVEGEGEEFCWLVWHIILHGPSMSVVKAKIYGVLYNQASSIAFDETSSYWSALKSS